MSHEIVKALSLNKKTKECWCTSYSNNVSPKTPERWEIKGISEIYKNDGEEAATKELLKMYWEGSFQPGTLNTFYKAVSVFRIKNPSINWDSVGPVLDEILVLGPVEDLPKYLNHPDRRVQDLVKRRLNGEVTKPEDFRPVIIMTDEDLLNQLYDIYKNYRTRVKGEFIIGTGTQFVANLVSVKSRSWYSTWKAEYAQVFDSWEEAAVMSRRFNFSIKNIINLAEFVKPKGDTKTMLSQGNY